MNDIVSINGISEIHDGKKIIFCKRDFVIEEFEKIKLLKNDVILITGNSDYCVDDELIKLAPSNIKKWFCQNRISKHQILESIPIGIQNSTPSKRHNDNCYHLSHGYIFEYAPIKTKKLLETKKSIFSKKNLLYANFRVETNLQERLHLKVFAKKQKHITWQDPNENYDNFIQGILDHEAVLCPNGNGPDSHRIYETAFLDRVAITFDTLQYEFIHKFFPVVCLTDLSELININKLNEKIIKAKSGFNKKYLTTTFWQEKIMDCAKKYNIV